MKKNDSRLLLGAHMPITGGLFEAIVKGESIGCTALQLFTKSNRQWVSKDPSLEEIELFKKTLKTSSVEMVIAHASYLINLGSPTQSLVQKSINATIKELTVCDKLGIPFLVLHPGSYTSSTSQEGITQITESLNAVFSKTDSSTKILLETAAGQGTTVGRTFEELAEIRKLVIDKNRVGICFDTCHAFASGYDFSTQTTYDAMWEKFDKIIGISHLKAIHINDSLKPCGSFVDRHTDIGKGEISLKAFELLMNDERFFDVPKILETPKDSLEDDVRNLKTLKSLLSAKNKLKL